MSFRAVLLAGVASFFVASLSINKAGAQSFSSFFAFGDSNIDSGYFLGHPFSSNNATKQALYNASAAVGGGIPTTPGGPANAQVLASLFGLTAIPVGLPGGTNYAASGSDVNDTLLNPGAPSIVSQISTYLAGTGGVANPNALYLINGGINDVANNAKALGAGTENSTTFAANLTQSANALAGAVNSLAKAGARYIIVADAGPGGSPTLSPAFINGRRLFVNTLYSNLSASGVNFVPADNATMQNIVLQNPAMFGFTSISNVSGPGGAACLNPNSGLFPTSWSLVCTTLSSPNAAQTSYWADDEHLSAAAQKIEADYDYSLIVAPIEISYMAEAPLKTRATVVDSIQNQIAISQRQRNPGTYNAWGTGDVMHLAMNSGSNGFPSDPGTPVSGSFGVDYAFAPGWLLGAAISGGTTTQSFSLGGNFRQNEYAVSVYTAFNRGSFWGDVIGSFGGLHYDENRVVPIGITMQSNTGGTNGTNPSLAAEIGYNFNQSVGTTGAVSSMPIKAVPAAPATTVLVHGPVAGIILQRVKVDGFAEADQFAAVGGFTELSFSGQARSSAVTELGYQASIDWGAWHPFAKLAWNHELDSMNRSVTAFVTSFATLGITAPGFSMPAVVLGRDWGAGTIGTTYALTRSTTAYATFTSQFGQHQTNIYGGQLGLNVALNSPTPSLLLITK